ncbi:MAG: hypothetical protein ACXVIY_05925 [Mucilaginibacter sp.]
MNYITLLKGLFSNVTSPTASQWQTIRNDALKLAAVCVALIAAAKSGNIQMTPGLQNVLQYVAIICGVSAGQSQSAINTSAAPATPQQDGPAS